jgi:hypothetical protein
MIKGPQKRSFGISLTDNVEKEQEAQAPQAAAPEMIAGSTGDDLGVALQRSAASASLVLVNTSASISTAAGNHIGDDEELIMVDAAILRPTISPAPLVTQCSREHVVSGIHSLLTMHNADQPHPPRTTGHRRSEGLTRNDAPGSQPAGAPGVGQQAKKKKKKRNAIDDIFG